MGGHQGETDLHALIVVLPYPCRVVSAPASHRSCPAAGPTLHPADQTPRTAHLPPSRLSHLDSIRQRVPPLRADEVAVVVAQGHLCREGKEKVCPISKRS